MRFAILGIVGFLSLCLLVGGLTVMLLGGDSRPPAPSPTRTRTARPVEERTPVAVVVDTPTPAPAETETQTPLPDETEVAPPADSPGEETISALTESPAPEEDNFATPVPASEVVDDVEPGVGVGRGKLGQKRAEVIEAMGQPKNMVEPAGLIKTASLIYEGDTPDETIAFEIDPEADKVIYIRICDSRHALQGHPEARVSCTQETLGALPAFQKHPDSPQWDFVDQGIEFTFNNRGSRGQPRFGPHLLEDVLIYEPGHKPTF